MPSSLHKYWLLSAVILLTVGNSFAFAAYPAATPVPIVQTDKDELKVVVARYETWNRRNCNCLIALGVLFAFGVVCAFWAYSDCRNPVLWFLAGFILNVLALFIIFKIHHRRRGRRRYRRVISYWYVTR